MVVFWPHPFNWGLTPISDPNFQQALLGQLTAPWIATTPFLTLPVLGLPGWWADNAQPEFYDDVGGVQARD